MIITIIARIKPAQMCIEIIESLFPKIRTYQCPLCHVISSYEAIKRPHNLQEVSYTKHISAQVW